MTTDDTPAGGADLAQLATWLRPLASPLRLRLLRYLAQPRYLEEVASELRMSRQGARKHLDKLVRIGVLERRPGMRPTGPVTEYALRRQALFLIQDEFEKLSAVKVQLSDAPSPTVSPLSRSAPAPLPPGPCLYVMHGLGVGQRVSLALREGEEWVVGRHRRCAFVVDHDPYASNRHAAIRRRGHELVLTDLRSTNGTDHNWIALARGGEIALRHGDVLGVGKTLLLFWEGPPDPRR